MKLYGSKWVAGIAMVSLLAFAGCKDETTTGPGGNNTNPSIGVSLSTQSVTIPQGSSGSVGVSISRAGGFAGEIVLAVLGLPSGVTGDANPASVPPTTTSATINLAVGATVAAGDYTVTVQASGSGVTSVTATFTLTVTEVAQSSFSLALNPTSVSIQQGGTAAVTVSITRTNLTESIALSLTGAPPGLVTSFDPVDVSGNSSTLTLMASVSTVPGAYTLTIKGTANGVADQTATLELTITAAPPSDVKWTFCAATGVPNWVAFQNGTDPWVRATPSGNTYTFAMTAATGGIATVIETGGTVGTEVDIAIYYGTRDDLAIMGGDQCQGSDVRENYTGTVAGFAASDLAFVSMGGETALVVPGVDRNFALQNVPDGAHDIFAALVNQTLQGGIPTWSLNRVIIRRNQDPPNGAALPVFDFGATEAFAPLTRNVSLTNLGTDVATSFLGYHTTTGTTPSVFSDVNPSTATAREYPGIPSAQQATGDLHTLTFLATPPGQATPTETRTATIMFKEAVDKTVSLGPPAQTITVGAATSPYVMPRMTTAIQPDYSRLFVSAFSQNAGAFLRSLTITATGAYLGTATTYDVALPDFSSVPDWSGSWGFVTGTAVPWWFSATGWDTSGGVTASPFADGGIVRSVTRSGEFGS